MYNIGDIFYFDKDYSKRAEFCNKNNLKIVEIGTDENGMRYQIQEVPKPTDKELEQQEIKELKMWFDIEYSRKEQKYNRLISLNKADDDGISASEKLNQLYEEAEIKRARIQELEELI